MRQSALTLTSPKENEMQDKLYHTLDIVGSAANMVVAVNNFIRGYHWMKASIALARQCGSNNTASVTELNPIPTQEINS